MLTAKQLLILCVLAGQEQNGRDERLKRQTTLNGYGHELRTALRKAGQPMSLPAFYQLMARMEEADLVVGWYETQVIDGNTVKRRRYKTTERGRHEINCTLDFYRKASHALAGTEL